MKRLVLGLALLVGAIAPVGSVVDAAPARADVPPILLNGEDGTLGLYVYLGPSLENTSVPMMGTLPVKVCDGTDCETYTGNYMSDNEGYSLHRYINIQLSIAERFGKRAVTAQVPSDLVDGSKGWSTASNSVTGWTDSIAWFKARTSRPALEVQFKSIDKSSLTRADLCANFQEGGTLNKNMTGYFTFDLTGYTSVKYVLLENGVQMKTEDLSSALSSMTSIPVCGGGVMGSGLLKSIDGLSAGKSYKLTYTLSGAGKTDATATLDFITPGACPTGEIVLPPSPRPFYYGVLGSDGYLKSYLATGTFPWRLESIIGSRLAPVYFSPSKVGPYKGNMYGVRDSAEKWRYVKEVDDWALAVDSAVPISSANLLSYTVFADCATSSAKPTLSLDETTVKAADQACIIDANEIVPVKPGQCIVNAAVAASGVSSSGVGKRASTATVRMNYVFNSVGSFSRATTTTAPATTSKACAVKLTRTKATSTTTALLKCAGLTKKSGQKVSFRIASSSTKVCRATSSGVARRAKGTCRVTVRVMKGTKTVSSKVISFPVQ